MKDFSNIAELIFYIRDNYDNPNFLNYKKDQKLISYSNKEFVDEVLNFACGLKEIGFKKGDKIVNYSYQNPIWLIIDFGAILVGGVTVPIFDNISNDHLGYEIKHSSAKFIFCDNKENQKSFLQQKKLLKLDDVKEINFDEIIALGKKNIAKFDVKKSLNAINHKDLISIIYTSGSTGDPKGVMISHENLVSQIKDAKQFFDIKSGSDIALSFLPLAHIFERMVMTFYLSQGINIYFVDDITNLGNLLKEFKPTLMTTVPRMLEKVYAKINDGVENGSFIKRFLGKNALKRALTKEVGTKNNILDKFYNLLVYKKFQAALGGKINMIICGGAALSNDLERFYQNIGVNVLCGYGLTEASPVLAANCQKYYKFATVGKKFPSISLKIADDGELMAKGKNIMMGYYENPQATKQTIIDSWLLTGDLAQIDDEGFVKIIGRKKEMFKTSYGKYVCPVPIEQKIMQNLGFTLGVLLIAEGKKFVSALIFPDFDNLAIIKKKLNSKLTDDEFVQCDKLQRFCQDKIAKVNNNLDNWQQIKKFKLVNKRISIDSGEVTPSMKLKRKVIEEKFKSVVAEFYQ